MKKVFIMLAMLTGTLAASAQFEKGRTFIGADITGLDLNYSGRSDFNLGIGAKGGYFLSDNWLVYGELGYQHQGMLKSDDFNGGVGGRYYFQNNGVMMGAKIDYVHGTVNYNDVMPGIEIGYCFFLSNEVAIEPALYYNQSFQNHSQYSTVGLKVGISLFHAKDKLKTSVKEVFE